MRERKDSKFLISIHILAINEKIKKKNQNRDKLIFGFCSHFFNLLNNSQFKIQFAS